MKKSLPDIFADGARKGFNIGVNSIMPNVLMAYVVIQLLKVTGLLDILGRLFAPVMAFFGLPGEGIMVLVSAWMSMGGGGGVAASLYNEGVLDARHATIVLPAIILMGAQVQYMGRLLGTSGVASRHYPIMFLISIVNALCAMLVMRFFV